MPNPPRKIAFITVATDQGTLIVNRFDQHIPQPNAGCGVGFQLLERTAYEPGEVNLLLTLLDLRRKHYGDGVIAVDCGANIGVHTVEWAKHMTGWGVVLAIEAQERIYYALAGNIAINNCFNARAIHAAVTNQPGVLKMPSPNYFAPADFGHLELRKHGDMESIGQEIDYSETKMIDVRALNLDSFNFNRLDLIKIDVVGMEIEALTGAVKCIDRHRPIVLVETAKTDKDKLRARLEISGYLVHAFATNFLAIHKDDKCLPHIKINEPKPA
jgi:FkbM family methyltransferase